MAKTPFERRQRQEAERITRRAMPRIEKVMKELGGQQRYATQCSARESRLETGVGWHPATISD